MFLANNMAFGTYLGLDKHLLDEQTNNKWKGSEEWGKKQDVENDKKGVKIGPIFIQCDVNEMQIPFRAARESASLSSEGSSDPLAPEEGGPASSSRELLGLAQKAPGDDRKPSFQHMRQRSLEGTSRLLNEASPHHPPRGGGFKSWSHH